MGSDVGGSEGGREEGDLEELGHEGDETREMEMRGEEDERRRSLDLKEEEMVNAGSKTLE